MKKSKLRKKQVLSAVLSAALLTNSVQAAGVAATSSVYNDGTYTGTATGFNGDVTASVTVTDGAISGIDIISQQETPAYWSSALEIIPNIIAANQTEGVDAISGATMSSEAIKNAVVNALADSVNSELFESGNGSASNPYMIDNASQLSKFAESVDGGENYLGKYIALGADIDLSDIDNWNPIGAEGTASANLDKIFAGDFDGRGHVIKGLTITTSEGTPYTDEHNIGLFSTLLSTAKVSGIRLENVNINVAGEKVVRAGGITGDITSNAVSGTEAYAAIDNCTVDGTISAETDAAMVMTGGIAGRAAGNTSISNCISETAINSSSGTKIAYGAGIVSMAGNDTYVINCGNRGDITVLTTSGFSLYAGGVVGMMTSEQYNCFSTGNITVGTIAQSDAANNAGIINGALMPAGSGSYDYYATSAEMYYKDETASVTAIEAVSHGAGSMHAEGAFIPTEVTEVQLNSGEFADILNENLYAISKTLESENIQAELRLWQLSDSGTIVLSDEVYVNDTIDASIFESGDGTEQSPYTISTADQLRGFAASLSEHIDYSDTFIELMNDVDVSGSEWIPIGDNSYPFNGSFDGKGHTVSGLNIGTSEAAKELEAGKNYIGFFSILGTNATVKNVNLTDVLINASYPASAYAGGITAAMDSDDSGYKGAVIDNCSVEGSITITAETGNNFVGGIAAYVYKGAIINCKTDVDASCTVKSGGAYGETGGIAALVNRGLVANSYSLGNVYGSGNRADEGMAVISALVAVNAGYLVNCYGNGQHETNDYSLYTGALSGWITGIGHAYDCYYNSEASMKIGETAVDPVADVGTRVASGVSDDGMVYTGGVVSNNEAYDSQNYSELAAKLNANFDTFPAELTLFGITEDSLKMWTYDNVVTFSSDYATATYVQPEAEIVTKQELTLNDGTWYGRDSEKNVVVTIKVENGEITEIISSDGSTDGDSYHEALQTAKEKSTYNDKTTYAVADVTRFAGGEGTEEKPYLISTEAQLRYIAEAMNDDVDWENIWFALDSDVTLTGGDWLPIGHAVQAEINGQKENFAVYPFRGNFDGREHTISGLTIGSGDAPEGIYLAGLFGLVAGNHDTNDTPTDDERLVNIKNVKLRDISINVDSRYEANVGGLVAWAQNGFVIDNCSVEGTINAKTKESFARVGGLVGSTLRGVITDSYTNVEINAATDTSSVYAGGLAGMTNRSAQVNCYTLGNICANAESNNKAMVGGLTGMSGGTNINCYTYGNVESLITTVDVGGINGRSAGIAADYECYFNNSAVYRTAGKEIAEKAASGTLVGEEINTSSKTAAEMASKDFADVLNANKANMTKILEDVSAYLEDMTESSKEGLSHLLFYTNDGTDLNTWVKDTTAPIFGTEDTTEPATEDTTEPATEDTTEPATEDTTESITEDTTQLASEDTTEPTTEDGTKFTENANITSDEELCNWAQNDYQSKNGISDTNAAMNKKENGDYEITITDKNGKVLDKYTIDPKNGTGVNSDGEAVNLPQTGNNSIKNILMVALAFMLIALGILCINDSAMIHRREDEE